MLIYSDGIKTMDTFSIIGFALAAAVLAFTVKEFNPRAAVYVSIAGGAVILFLLVGKISGITDELNDLANMSGISADTVKIMLKAVGIAYTAQFAAELCRDMGENALAVKAEITGRIMLLTLALPVIKSIAGILRQLIEEGIP